MLLYLARLTQVMHLEVHPPQSYLDNAGTLHASLDDAKTALSSALMHEARKCSRPHPADLPSWDDPTRARGVRSFEVNGEKGLWMEAVMEDTRHGSELT